ncbi:motility associated factor glycosyltransferase family protein [Spirochaeta isovalerica]|uniref:DUF115 domain-containing protein n=1 Tax=Spirochaeta isovalerica TaxID=150 RepID=A0A841R4D6_9SPIO|nr:6-hydroxymethylpterin diphosphokinase MptE-like protein [Spirochaeta isovalerica]MBB6478666.1 hypothetical protein [Spirochaeta isovalerica]
MSILADNLHALDIHFPSLSHFLKDYSETLTIDDYKTSVSRTGCPTIEINGQLIHSRFDPQKESYRFIENQLSGDASIYIQGGFGLGYHSEALLELTEDEILIIVEPDIKLFYHAMCLRDLRHLINCGRIIFLIDSEPDNVLAILEQFPGKLVQIIITRSLYDYKQNYYDSLRNKVGNYISRKEVNLSTLKRFGKLWLRNLSENAHLLAEVPGIRSLDHLFDGLPALLIAAGPSLDTILPYLEKLKERFILVAVDTALRACLKENVEPDFIVVADPQYWNSRHMDRCPTDQSILISDTSTFPSVFRQIKGKKFLSSSSFPLGLYLEENTELKGKLKAGGSVATAAWDFCRIIGASEIWCAGLDLGFPDKQTHCRGSFFEQRVHWLSERHRPAEDFSWHALIDAGLHKVEANDGGLTWTDRRMNLYVRWFEEQMEKYPVLQSFNISQKGIKIRGMGFSTLAEALKKPINRMEIDLKLNEAGQIEPSPGLYSELIKSIESLIENLSSLHELADRGLQLCHKLEENFKKGHEISRILTELNKIDAAIINQSGKEIAAFILQNFITDLLGEKKSPTPEQTINNSISLYEELNQSIGFHRELLQKALKNTKISQE